MLASRRKQVSDKLLRWREHTRGFETRAVLVGRRRFGALGGFLHLGAQKVGAACDASKDHTRLVELVRSRDVNVAARREALATACNEQWSRFRS